MHRASTIVRYVVVFISFATLISATASASEEAYRDCIQFYGLPSGHPKLPEVKQTCREVTKTMEEWKALKRALCASTPNDEKCKEFHD